MRDMTRKETVQLDTAEPGAEGGLGTAEFQTASEDGSRVFFTDTQRLTIGSTASGRTPDLYEFELAGGGGPLVGKLTDLTVDTDAGESADVLGTIPGASEDGSYAYFVANGVLGDGAEHGATRGNCKEAGSPALKTCNLYVAHYDGTSWTTTFIAALSGEDAPDWADGQADLTDLTSRVSPSGRFLAFMSERSLTGYDNRDTNSGEPDEEVFLYDANSDRLVCASCNPTGARPSGVFDSLEHEPIGAGDRVWTGHWLAGNIPGWTPSRLGGALYQSRYLSNGGRLFFNSSDTLVPQDTNGLENVYEYEPPGVGDCEGSSETFSERSGGCVGLISSGTSSEESAFLDASASGDDVFFLTTSPLVPQDVDSSYDVYDAHVCSASAPCAASSTGPPPCATADSCRVAPALQPGIFGPSGSATFSGAGNVAPLVAKLTLKSLTAAQKLANALKGCKKKPTKKRVVCESRAKKRYKAKKIGARKSAGRRQMRARKGERG